MDLELKIGDKNHAQSSARSSPSEIMSIIGIKRSSSAPTGLNFVGLEISQRPSTSDSLNSSLHGVSHEAVLPANIYRRNSTVCYSIRTPDSAKKTGRRLHCLRREGDVRNCIETDYAGERFFRSAAQISTGWSDFQIDESPSPVQSVEERKRAKSVCEPVHIFTNFLPASCSPSPTRNEKVQCYSPSMQQVVRKAYFSPSPSPSPTRRSFLRSLSPIAVRQQIGLKRKYDSDGENSLCVSAKRVAYTPPVPMQIDNEPPHKVLPISNVILNHSLSVSSLDSESSSNSTICSDFTTASERSLYSVSAPPIGIVLFDSVAAPNNNNGDDNNTEPTRLADS